MLSCLEVLGKSDVLAKQFPSLSMSMSLMCHLLTYHLTFVFPLVQLRETKSLVSFVDRSFLMSHSFVVVPES